MKEGEVVLRLRANRMVKCRECHGWIYPGQTFLLDIIPYVEAFGPFRRVKKVKRPIHEHHWRGPKNIIVNKAT